MSKLMDAIKSYLDRREWNYELNAEAGAVSLRMKLETVEQCAVFIQTRDDDAFTVYTIFPVNITPERRAAAAELVTRANYGLVHGNFEMDYADGEIRYKVTCDCGENVPDIAQIDRSVNIGFFMLDRYAPAIFAVLLENVSPQTAVENVERNEGTEDAEDAEDAGEREK